MAGIVYLVGAGPGAPDLLTLRAARLLAVANVVFYDALVHPDTLALAACAQKIPVGKRCGGRSSAQRFINTRLVDAASRHPVVVRLKGGDPMLFGRAQEEIDALCEAGVAVQVVPGLSATFAASAELCTSLTLRGVARSLILVTPRAGVGEVNHAVDWGRSVAAADSAALYMAAGEAEAVRDALIKAGVPPSTPVVVAESVSLPDARYASGVLASLPELAIRQGSGPALILLGEVFRRCGLRRLGTEAAPPPAHAAGLRRTGFR